MDPLGLFVPRLTLLPPFPEESTRLSFGLILSLRLLRPHHKYISLYRMGLRASKLHRNRILCINFRTVGTLSSL